jgi:inhibitor of KinA sporulation pathway (predicted exonuclease)
MSITEFICILDFEATCNNEKTLHPIEIIEFPSVLIKNGEVISEFQRYVRPVINQQLTSFCTELTSITQDTLDLRGVSFTTALNDHTQWLMDQCCGSLDNILFVTCGDWDLKTMLPEQLSLSNIREVPSHFHRWCNIKIVYNKHKGLTGRPHRIDMLDILKGMNLELQGHHHSGIDDCRNIARIVQALMLDGCKIVETTRLVEK